MPVMQQVLNREDHISGVPLLTVFLCSKKYVHGICIFGLDDLQHLQTKTHLFANKFLFDFEYAAVHCMGEWLHNKTIKPPDLDLTKYKILPFLHSNR